MSYVTTATLLVSEYGDVTEAMLTEHGFPRDAPKVGHYNQTFKKMPDDAEWFGGYKFMECDLFAAGFNYVPGPEIEEWFKGLPWGQYGAAFLVWETNGEKRGSASVGWVDW